MASIVYTSGRLQPVASEPSANLQKVKPDPECEATAQRILDLVLKSEIGGNAGVAVKLEIQR